MSVSALLMTCVVAGGCTSVMGRTQTATSNLDVKQGEALGYGPDAGQKVEAMGESGLPMVYLEVRNGGVHRERFPIPPDKPYFVADLVSDTNLTKRVGRIKVTVARETVAGQPPVRMDVDFDSSGKNVMVEQNYALQPGDRVFVSKDESTVFTRTLEKFGRR